MEFIKNGSTVTLSNGEVKAIVIGVCIRGIEPNLRFEYNVSWFVGGSRECAWVESYEIEIYNDTKKKAGLVNYENEPSKLIE